MADRRLEYIRHALGSAIVDALADTVVTDILVNEDGVLWVERLGGSPEKAGHVPEKDRRGLINSLAAHYDTICIDSSPVLSCELPGYGARFEANVPPVVSAPMYAIRKPAVRVFALHEYVDARTMTAEQANRIVEAVQARQNIIVAGGTGSGKTTLANAIIREMGENERVVVIEDTPEIQCVVVNRTCKLTSDYVDTAILLRSALRQRPDRILIGEVRDGVAWDLLKAWNTGHSGGVCTIHANAEPAGVRRHDAALRRLEQLIGENRNAPGDTRIVREVVAETVDLVVYVFRNPQTHGRYVGAVVEVGGCPDGGSYEFRVVG